MFRTLAALARELLRKRREAGDVGEHGGALGDPVGRLRIVDQVMLEDAGEIRNRAFGVGIGHGQVRSRPGFAGCAHVTALPLALPENGRWSSSPVHS